MFQFLFGLFMFFFVMFLLLFILEFLYQFALAIWPFVLIGLAAWLIYKLVRRVLNRNSQSN